MLISSALMTIDATTWVGTFLLLDFTDSNCSTVYRCLKLQQHLLIPSTATEQELQDIVNSMKLRSIPSVTISISNGGTVAEVLTLIHYLLLSPGDKVEFSGSAETTLNNVLLSVIGTPTRYGFTVDASSISGLSDMDISGTASVTFDNGVVVTKVDHAQPSEGATYSITFSGSQVSGNIPQLTIVSNHISGDADNCAFQKICLSSATVVEGHQICGFFTLLYKDSMKTKTHRN